jgi:hypothetical protein
MYSMLDEAPPLKPVRFSPSNVWPQDRSWFVPTDHDAPQRRSVAT